MTFIVNDGSFEASEINADASQGLLLSPTLFILYINVLPRNIRRSLVNTVEHLGLVFGEREEKRKKAT